MSEERQAFMVIGTASDDGPVHCMGWMVPHDEEAMKQVMATLTEAYGPPREWVTDEASGQFPVILDTEPG